MRYWDGQTWVGEPTTNASTSAIYYAAAAPQAALVGASAVDPTSIGITYRVTTEAPAEQVEPIAVPTPAIPASAQLIAIGLSVLKAVPLALMLLNTVLIAVFGTIGLQFAYNQDVETVLALAVGFSLLYVAIGAGLLAAQASGAARNKPVRLLVAAVVITCIDSFLTLGGWTNDHSTDHFFYTGLLVLQGWVLIGAIIGMAKTTT